MIALFGHGLGVLLQITIVIHVANIKFHKCGLTASAADDRTQTDAQTDKLVCPFSLSFIKNS
jgi:hypothetical protein